MTTEIAARPSSCCACGSMENEVFDLGAGILACGRHSREEIVRTAAAFAMLRRAEVAYFRDHRVNPAAVVWCSRHMSRLRSSEGDACPRLPDGLLVLMIQDDAFPAVFAVGEDLADSLADRFGRDLPKRRS